MGHDITAIRKSALDSGSEDELSYIRIGAWNRHKAYMLYDALEAEDCNGGVSGNGGEKEFTPDQLKIALAKFKYMTGEPKDEILAYVEASKGSQMGNEFLNQVMVALTGDIPQQTNPDDEQIQSNNEDILRFLTEIQVEEPVIIQFF